MYILIQGVRKRLYVFKKFNQCNLHHSPHTGHLEKKNKKRVQSFSDILYIHSYTPLRSGSFSSICIIQPTTRSR